MAFTTLAKVKTELGIPTLDTTHDARLTALVAAVNAHILAIFQLDDTPVQAYTTKYDMLDTAVGFWLREYPVTGVTTVKIDDTTLVAADFYLARPKTPGGTGHFGMLNRKVGEWPTGRQLIEVTHNAGFATIPGDLETAATLGVSLLFNTGGAHAGKTSEKIGQYSYSIGGGGVGGLGAVRGGSLALPAEANAILGAWTRAFAPGSP